MSDIEITEQSTNFYNDTEVSCDIPNITLDETPSILQETCENNDIEVTSINLANTNGNNNHVDKIDDSDKSEITPSSVRRNSSLAGHDKYVELCLICESKIYPMEKMNIDGKLYHKNCFRCIKCRTILSVNNFSLFNNSIYCKIHAMELFKITGGKYNDGGNICNDIVLQNQEKITEEIPTADTKGLLEMFRQMDTGTAPLPGTTTRNINATVRHAPPSEDIVRSQDVQLDELPAPETTKSMAAKFRAMETKTNIPTPEKVQEMQWKAKVNSTPNANIRLQSNSTNLQNMEAGECNSPDELPEEGTTKNLLSKFQNLSNNA